MIESSFNHWLKSFVPDALTASMQERLRAAFGVCLAVMLTLGCSLLLFGPELALCVAPPMGASALLLFVVSSSPFAQPWPVLGGNLLCSLIGILLGLSGLDPVLAAGLGTGLALATMFVLRCMHPPSCALTLLLTLGWPELQSKEFELLYPIAFNSLMLLSIALVYNNLTGHPYPKARAPRANPHHTRDLLPSDRLSFTSADLDAALDEFDEYIDVTREDLERLLKSTEKHALRRSMGEVTAADIMSRDLHWATPDTFINQAWLILRDNLLRNLPVVDGETRQLLGIVTQIDLLQHFQPSRSRLSFGRLNYLRGTKLRAIMSTPVVSVPEDMHMADLVFLLSDRGLHCLPVVDGNGRLVGMVTQTDLIAALYRIWLQHLSE